MSVAASPPVDHLWGQRWLPPTHRLDYPQPDDSTTEAISPRGLGSFSFRAEALIDGPRWGKTDDHRGRDKSPHERHTQPVKALPTG